MFDSGDVEFTTILRLYDFYKQISTLKAFLWNLAPKLVIFCNKVPIMIEKLTF